MREIKISLETATRWYNGTDTELKELAIQTYPELVKKELPKTWDELGGFTGFCAKSKDVIWNPNKRETNFNTYEQAEASIAMAQLSQLIAIYNDGWVADWTDRNFKYAIFYSNEKIVIADICNGRTFLTFKDKETAELFLENFKDLILTAKPLL